MSVYANWTYEIAWASDPGDPSPTWADMKPRVNGAIASTRGRQAEGSDISPGTLEVILDDSDGELTAGNPLSTTDVQLGKMCRLQETVGANTYDRYFGYLTDIDPDVWTDSGDRAVRLTFTDELDRLARAQAFVSTLGAHIMGEAADSLVLYYPLDDPRTPFPPLVGAGDMVVAPYMNINPSPVPADMVTPATIAGPAGDDATFPDFTPEYFDPPTPISGCGAMPYGTAHVAVHVASGESIAVSAWMRPMQQIPALAGGAQDSFFLALLNDVGYPTSLGSHGIYFFDRPESTGTANADQGGATFVQVVAPGPFPREVWRLITARLTLPTGAFTLWIGSDVVVSGVMAGAPSSTDFSLLHFGSQYFGSLAHIQVHVGVGAFTYSDHVAQSQAGMVGLERQKTGARIATLAGYAGVTATDIDEGTTEMGPARLAGLTAGDAMASAATTENGDLYATGAGALRFRDRRSRYNQTAAATIHHNTIDDGLRPRVDGPIINMFEATTPGGDRARSTDAASIAAKRVFTGDLEVDTMQPSELAAAALHRTSQYAVQRVRVPVLPVDLLHATNAVRDAVLALDIGDRADLSAMAADYPAGADKLIIEGYKELVGEEMRRIDFVTSPVLGLPAGTPATWFKLDDPTLGQLDAGNPLAY